MKGLKPQQTEHKKESSAIYPPVSKGGKTMKLAPAEGIKEPSAKLASMHDAADAAGRLFARSDLEKQALGAELLQGLKGIGSFLGSTGKNVYQAARTGGGLKAMGQTLGGAGQMGASTAGKWIAQNPGAAATIGGAGLAGAAGVGHMMGNRQQ